MNNKTLKYPIVIHDALLVLVLTFSLLFYSLYLIFPHFGVSSIAIKASLIVFLFLGFAVSFTSYLFIEYRYNHLTFKNIFFYLSIGIALLNIVAVASLPNTVYLPNSGVLNISVLDRVYYLLSGFALAALPVTFFYLIPRRVNNRHYINIILIGILLIVTVCILVSFVMDYQAYVKIFTSHFKDIDVGLNSMFGAKNIFARILLTGIVAATLLHSRTKNWKWLLVLIPFGFILFLSAAKMSILLGAIYLIIYLIIYVVLWAKKSRDNTIIASLIGGFVILIGIYLVTMTVMSSGDGILSSIKNSILNAIDNLKVTFGTRQKIWWCSLALLAPYQFIFGFGVSSFGMALHQVYVPPIAPEWDKFIYAAHNGGIELIGRGGVLMLLIYLFLYVYLFYLCVKLYKKKPLSASIMMVVLIGYLLHSLVESFFVCNGHDVTTTALLTVPIICEYNICYKKESDVKTNIVESTNRLRKIKSDSKLFNLNKKVLLIEAKHINSDLEG